MRYHFNIIDRDGTCPDAEGVEFTSLVEATAHALKGARSLICQDVQWGLLDLSGCITVTDETGIVVYHLPFVEAVTVTPIAKAA